MPSPTQQSIADALATKLPDVEVILAEISGGTVRLYIDHPDGVTLAHCQEVTEALGQLRETHALEVSSPGNDRPLTKPEHFERFKGRTARLRLVEPLPEHPARTLSGEIVEAGPAQLTIAVDDGVVSLPYTAIGRANLVPAA